MPSFGVLKYIVKTYSTARMVCLPTRLNTLMGFHFNYPLRVWIQSGQLQQVRFHI